MRSLMFTLPFALDSLNVQLRTHQFARGRKQKQMSQEVMAAIGGPRYYPRPPFGRALVKVYRHSAGRLDADNLGSCTKQLLDSLCEPSVIHPHGLGIIVDDAPHLCQVEVHQVSAPRGQQHTRVVVEELLAVEAAAGRRAA